MTFEEWVKPSVLIFRCNRRLSKEDLIQLRKELVQQVREGVVLLPSYVDVFKPIPIEATKEESED